jgi:APA family basic amino acid/polyamine antiporter
VLQSAGLLFFAFAGYARIATMGEEVREPRRTIPRAIVLALAVAVVARSGAPLVDVVASGVADWAVRVAVVLAVCSPGRTVGLRW